MDTHLHRHNASEEITWSRLGEVFTALAESIRVDYDPALVVGIAKGGVMPAVFLSSAFLINFIPVKLTSRHNEEVVREKPVWEVYPPAGKIAGQKVLLVDDICITGQTLSMAKKELLDCGAEEIRTVTIAVHFESFRPDYFQIRTDALIIWPWDKNVLDLKGKWSMNREYLDQMESGFQAPSV